MQLLLASLGTLQYINNSNVCTYLNIPENGVFSQAFPCICLIQF